MDVRDDWQKPWQGERICVVCWKPRLGLNDEGACEQCVRDNDPVERAVRELREEQARERKA